MKVVWINWLTPTFLALATIATVLNQQLYTAVVLALCTGLTAGLLFGQVIPRKS